MALRGSPPTGTRGHPLPRLPSPTGLPRLCTSSRRDQRGLGRTDTRSDPSPAARRPATAGGSMNPHPSTNTPPPRPGRQAATTSTIKPPASPYPRRHHTPTPGDTGPGQPRRAASTASHPHTPAPAGRGQPRQPSEHQQQTAGSYRSTAAMVPAETSSRAPPMPCQMRSELDADHQQQPKRCAPI